MTRPNFGRRFQSLHAAASKAKPKYVCRGCGLQHDPITDPDTGKRRGPAQCACGRIDFDYFGSKREADRWAGYMLSEKLGRITNLKRQVRYPLYAYGPNGERAEVAYYVADIVYDEDGQHHIIDVKPKRGIDDLARLKLKWMHAQGILVEIVT